MDEQRKKLEARRALRKKRAEEQAEKERQRGKPKRPPVPPADDNMPKRMESIEGAQKTLLRELDSDRRTMAETIEVLDKQVDLLAAAEERIRKLEDTVVRQAKDEPRRKPDDKPKDEPKREPTDKPRRKPTR